MLSQVATANATVLLSGAGLPSAQEEFSSQLSVLTLTVSSFGEASCPSGAIEGVVATVVNPGFSLSFVVSLFPLFSIVSSSYTFSPQISATFPKPAVADGCKITAQLTRFDQSSLISIAATVVNDLPAITENTSRGFETKASWQLISILGSNFPAFTTEIAFSSVSLSWNCAEPAPQCSSISIIEGGISCNVTIASGHRCLLSATVTRLGASSVSTRIGSVVTPRSFVPTNFNVTVGTQVSLLLNISVAEVFNSDEKLNSMVSLASVGTGCTWSTGGALLAVFDADDRVNATVFISTTEPAGCTLQGIFYLYGIGGTPVAIGSTVSPLTPVAAPSIAPVASGSPVSAPVASVAPVAAPTLLQSPPAIPQSIFVVVSGTTFPTALNLQRTYHLSMKNSFCFFLVKLI